jgi:UDP-glucose 4-epimerase
LTRSADQHAIITGGAGFIGSHLAQRVVARGGSVLLVDDLSTGDRANVDALLQAHPDRTRLIVGRAAEVLQQPDTWRDATHLFHLAATVGVKRVVQDPPAMIRTNVADAAACLTAAADAGVKTVLASSSEVYGKCPVLPLREDMELVYGPTTASRWAYGLTKALDEHLALDLHRRSGLRVVCTRFFNTIGPRQVGRYGMVVPRFVERAVRGEPLEVYGNGEQTRAFADVADVVAAVLTLVDEPAAWGKVVNVGSDQAVTVNRLAQMVIELTDGRSKLVHVPYERVYGEGFEDPPHRLPDVKRLVELTGGRLDTPLRHTLERLVVDAQRARLVSSALPKAGGTWAESVTVSASGPESER